MNKTQYMAKLNKLLKGIDKQTRQEILLEITSSLEELSPEAVIEEHFGSVEALAQQYLQDEIIKPSATQNMIRFSKKTFLMFGVFVALLLLVFYLFVKYEEKDLFDYSNLDSPELIKNGVNWHSVEWAGDININIDQARVIFYWHDKKAVDWNCGDDSNIKIVSGETFFIRRAQCLIFIPQTSSNLTIEQSSVVFIKPLATSVIYLKQSSLRIAEKGNQYDYSINLNESSAKDLRSVDGSTSITINARQSQIKAYKH